MVDRNPLGPVTQRAVLLAGTYGAEVERVLRQRGGLEVWSCRTAEEVCRHPAEEAALFIAAEDSLAGLDLSGFRGWLAAQPTWSDLGVIVLSRTDNRGDRHGLKHAFGNLSLLAYPFAADVLLSLVDVAIRARGRQRQARELARRVADCEDRFHALFETDAAGIASVDRNGQVVATNRRFGEMFGAARPTGDLAALFGNDSDLVQRILTNALAREATHPAELARTGADGTVEWLRLSAKPFPQSDSVNPNALVIVEDVSLAKRVDKERRALLRELSHRVKNTLAVVQAMAKQTARRTESKTDFVAAFEARIASLAKTHSLLTDADWAGADLRTLIETELTAPRGALLPSLSGPSLRLAPAAATSFGMLIHELATNARRHGSLSVRGGAVVISWNVVERPDGQHLLLHWREEGGPAPKPPAREGFGLRLLRSSARTEIRYEPGGLECDIDYVLQPSSPSP